MPKENTEDRIMDSAIKLFYQKGYNGASTSEIAKEAGIAEGTIFRYFKTKKEILNQVLIKLIENLSQSLITDRMDMLLKENKGQSTRDILKVILSDRVVMIDENWETIKIIITEMQFHEDIKEAFFKNVVSRVDKLLDKLIESGIEKGCIKNINKVLIKQVIVGNFASYIIRKKFMNCEEIINIDDVIDVLLNGIGTEEKFYE
ncbi:MAG: TetR/AcrR family transcriptional regulator [Bacillota bacterium]|nr:TetR/AcrR family transcriptional regulator [Bacillota bacterium]